MPSVSEQLTAQFYQWEILGRGWLLSEDAIHLEAPFTPFFGHFLWTEPEYKDDGIRHTFVSALIEKLKKPKIQPKPAVPEISYRPYIYEDDEETTTLHVTVQKDLQFKAPQVEQFLSMLAYCTNPISFEICATKEKITIQFVCRESDVPYLKAQFQTYFPLVYLREGLDALDYAEYQSCATVDFGLEQEFMRPLGVNHSLDSLTGLFSLFEHVEEDQKIVFQVLFNGLVNRWENSMLRSVSDGNGKSFFEDSPEMISLAREKASKPLLAVCIRSIVFDLRLERAFDMLEKVAFAIKQSYSSSSNALIPLSDSNYPVEQRFEDIILRTSHRLGMLLNVEELAGLVHLPSSSLISSKVLNKVRKTKLAPTITQGHEFFIGISEDQGEQKKVTISNEQRLKHTHIIGATGTGKSTLLSSMVVQDIALGNGVAVLDPHGDLIETVLKYIPDNRTKDVIVLDPSDVEYPIGFNILQAYSEIEKEVLSSDLVFAFKRLSTSWGDQMHSVLSNAILAFLESKNLGTLVELRRFLLEPQFRNQFLQSVSDYNIHYYWQKQYPLLKGGSIGPILTRLDTFLRSRLIRNMVAQRRGLDFEMILDNRKILLVKLSQGLIGEENSYLLGSFIVSKIHQAALARQAKQERHNFFLYIDEFQHFITPSMASILSGARKYHLGLVLAHQDLQQLQRSDSDIASSVLSNAGTRICFRVGDGDAKKLAEGFSFFDSQDLQNLSVGEAIARVEKPEFDFSLATNDLSGSTQYQNHNSIIERSRATYASPRDIVEEELLKTINIEVKLDPIAKQHIPEIKTPEKKPVVETHISKEASVNPIEVQVEIPAEKVEEITRNLVKKSEDSQHRKLQNLIKRIGESKGYKSTIEAAVSSGVGKVDVLLENEVRQIACEVCVTTDIDWEIHNIQKCLKAGYSEIISCVADAKRISVMQKKIDQVFNEPDRRRIKVMVAESLMSHLDIYSATEMQTETTYKGYRVKITYNPVTTEEQDRLSKNIAKTVYESAIKKNQRPPSKNQ